MSLMTPGASVISDAPPSVVGDTRAPGKNGVPQKDIGIRGQPAIFAMTSNGSDQTKSFEFPHRPDRLPTLDTNFLTERMVAGVRFSVLAGILG